MITLVSDTAMLMAAGLGKRMRPLTATTPKPLVRVAGKPLIDRALDRLEEAGVARAVVNVHYLADAIEAHVGARKAPTVTFSILRTVSMPEITLPKTTCLLSSQSHASHVIKNWQPLVPAPLLAIESSPCRFAPHACGLGGCRRAHRRARRGPSLRGAPPACV